MGLSQVQTLIYMWRESVHIHNQSIILLSSKSPAGWEMWAERTENGEFRLMYWNQFFTPFSFSFFLYISLSLFFTDHFVITPFVWLTRLAHFLSLSLLRSPSACSFVAVCVSEGDMRPFALDPAVLALPAPLINSAGFSKASGVHGGIQPPTRHLLMTSNSAVVNLQPPVDSIDLWCCQCDY